jgi:hypothetical protein
MGRNLGKNPLYDRGSHFQETACLDPWCCVKVGLGEWCRTSLENILGCGDIARKLSETEHSDPEDHFSAVVIGFLSAERVKRRRETGSSDDSKRENYKSFRRWLICLVTNSTEQSPSWEANSHSDSQENPRLLRNPKVQYYVTKPQLVSVLS